MSIEDLLDRLLIPRSNGSQGLEEVAGFIQETLRAFTPEVDGIPAVTLMAATAGGPRGLHSASDSRERPSIPALARAVNFLEALVTHADQNPGVLESVN